jgi:uncharacterized protein
MSRLLLADTGILYALADRRDEWHRRAVDYVRNEAAALLVPVTVVPEVTYLLQTRLGARAERAFVQSIVRREVTVEPLKEADVARADALMEHYPDIGFVDATVAAIAERLRHDRIATTDRHHFGPIRPVHIEAFELVP